MTLHRGAERPERRNSVTMVLSLILAVVIIAVVIYMVLPGGTRLSENAAVEPNTTSQQPEPGGAPAPRQETPGAAGSGDAPSTNP